MTRHSTAIPIYCTLLTALFLMCGALPASGQIYVKANALGANDGSSWYDAFTDLQSALGIAENGDSIWVAAGTYKPTPGTTRTATFTLKNGVSLFGGFAGNEVVITQRNFAINPTILSGDIGSPGSAEDNSYHVLTGHLTDSTARLDGFIVTGGHASEGGSHDRGGGLVINNGSPTITNVVFLKNHAVWGGAVSAGQCSAVFSNVGFYDNYAAFGGALYSYNDSAPIITNATFGADSVQWQGSAIYNDDAFPEIYNTVIWANSGVTQVINVGFGATAFYHSLIQGSGGSGAWNPIFGFDGGNNLDVDPRYVDDGGNFRLGVGSPAKDTGDDTAPHLSPTDLDGRPRIEDVAVDMGAYEFSCPGSSRLLVDPAASGIPDGTTWASAFTTLNEALASACPGVTEIWVTMGTYKPTTGANRAATFWLRNGLAVYGGFRGDETSLSERDVGGRVTVLSGDIGTAGGDDNSYHVITTTGTDATAVIDGFTVTGGDNRGTAFAKGAGLFNENGNATVRNITFDGNKSVLGGAVYSSGGNLHMSSIVFRENEATDGGGLYCTNFDTISVDGARFEDNTASGNGGAVYMAWSAGTLKDIRFRTNTAATGGGAVYVRNSSRPIVVNAEFIANSAQYGGGLYSLSGSTPVIVNATLAGNIAEIEGGGIFNNGAQPPYELVNTIMWENMAPAGPQIFNMDPGLLGVPVISYSLIGGSGGSGALWDGTIGVDGGNNIDTDPMFFSLFNKDVRLRIGSPAVDMGDENAPYLPATDLGGNPRILDLTVDMGAYEFFDPTGIGDPSTPSASGPVIESVFPNPFNPTVTVRFEIDRRREVRVRVFDVKGQLIRTIAEGPLGAGVHRVTWDSTDDGGGRAASGVYFIEVQSGSWRDSRKVILIK
ncbi:MAG: choice-of-anchor Q domain-containing protein [bacterium]